MQFGPDRILACPRCGARARASTLLSGNTIGAVQFTDGRMIAFMLPDLPAIAKCKGCGAFYWLDDAEVTRAWPHGRKTDDSIPRVEQLSAPEMTEALAAGLGSDRRRELYLRVRLWWADNGRSRNTRTSETQAVEPPERAGDLASLFDNILARNGGFPDVMSEEQEADWRRNAEALASLLDEAAGEERLMKAELARHFGRFEEARRLLDFPFDAEHRHHVAVIGRLVEQESTRLAVVYGDEGLTAEEQNEIEERRARREAEAREKQAKHEAFLARQEAARQRGILKDGEGCPKCGFKYAWDGTDCHHCHLHRPESPAGGSPAR